MTDGGAGALVLVGTPIGNLGDLSPRAVEALAQADEIAAEDTRRTRALLTHAGLAVGSRLRSVRAHNEAEAAGALVQRIRDGGRVAYVSDAGMPGVSDPGARLVRTCLDAGLAVEVVPGPSAVLAALVVSGLPTDRFCFEGFLPRRGGERRRRLASVASSDCTVVFFESPRRVVATLGELCALTGDDRPVAVSRELSKRFEETCRGTIADVTRRLAEAEPRGEYVVVVGPAVAPTTVDADVLEDLLRRRLARGDSVRDAADAVARDLGVGRRQVYQAAVALRDEAGERGR